MTYKNFEEWKETKKKEIEEMNRKLDEAIERCNKYMKEREKKW